MENQNGFYLNSIKVEEYKLSQSIWQVIQVN